MRYSQSKVVIIIIATIITKAPQFKGSYGKLGNGTGVFYKLVYILTTTLLGQHYCLHFIAEENKTQRG